jgi:uncharacterized protein HemX
MIAEALVAAASGGFDLNTWLYPIITVALAAAAGIAAYWRRQVARRKEDRTTSGDIQTSDAATLWAQSQAILAQQAASLAKAEEQRDRLMALQSNTLLPTMTATNETMILMKESLDKVNSRLDDLFDEIDNIGSRRLWLSPRRMTTTS